MLQVDKFGTANEKIDQHILPVPRSEKRTELCKLIGLDENTYTKLEDARIDKEKTLIFVNSVKYSDTLATFLSSCGINSIAVRIRFVADVIHNFSDAQSPKPRNS